MPTGTIAPFPKHQLFDANGDPANAYQLFTYLSGTATKVDTFTDAALSAANTNPIVLDSAGRCTIFLTPGVSYKFVFALPTDTDPPASPIWSVDGISAVPPIGSATDSDVSGTAGESLSASDICYLSDGSGGTTAGRWYKADADNTYSSTAAYQLGAVTTALSASAAGTFRIAGRVTGLAGLTAGTYYYVSATGGALTSTAPTNARPVAVADSTTSVIMSPWALGQASATVPGYVSLGDQTFGTTGIKTFPVPPIGIDGYARVTGDVTKNNSTTFGDVTGALFSVVASGDYEFECVLKVVGTNVANSKWQFTGPAAPTGVIYGVNSSVTPSAAQAAVAFSTSLAANLPNAIETMVLLKGHLRNGANAGTVQLQFAQATGEVSNLIVRAESYLTFRRRV